MSTILDIWSDPETSGIFTSLNDLNVPWKSDNVYESLNLQYYYNHSGQKNISPLVNAILGSGTSLTDAEKVKLANIAFSMYSKNWKYLYNAIFADYDPIENYNAIEAETIGTTGTRSGSGSETNTGTDTVAHTGTDTNIHEGNDNISDSEDISVAHTGTDTHETEGNDTTTNTGTVTDKNVNDNGTSTTANKIYGYNSADASNDSSQTVTVNQTITDTRTDDLSESVTKTETDTDTVDLKDATSRTFKDEKTSHATDTRTLNTSDARTLDTKTDKTDSETTSGNTTRNLTRHGNIGVTTSQQMIESEIELRKRNYFDIIFKDIDNILTLSVY